MTFKIANLNLQRGGEVKAAPRLQQQVIQDLDADVIVLTEPPASYRTGTGVVASPALRAGPEGQDSWVAVVGPSVERVDFEVPYLHLGVAARATIDERSVIIYGAVLPWTAVKNHAPCLCQPGESSFQVFERILKEQVSDVMELHERYGPPVIWAGDFNQTVTGLNYGGSEERRAALLKALDDLKFKAWNGTAAHANKEMCAVDLICGPRGIDPVKQNRIDPNCEGVEISDHAGYWVELSAESLRVD